MDRLAWFTEVTLFGGFRTYSSSFTTLEAGS
jgi:hypothetical protein